MDLHFNQSLANASRVSVEKFWNVFSGDAEKYFEIIPTEDKKELSLILDDATRKSIELKYITAKSHYSSH